MNAGKFARKQHRIGQKQHRSNRWKKRALRHLASEAKATPRYTGARLVGWQLPDGSVVCKIARYPSLGKAEAALTRIWTPGDNRETRPHRAFLCRFCSGWHLTAELMRNPPQD